MDATAGKGFSYVFGTSGASDAMKEAYAIASSKARICFIGTPGSPVTFTAEEWEMMNRREFVVTGSWMSYSAPFPGKEWKLSSEMMAQGRLRFDQRLVFRRYPLSQCSQAFACFQEPGQVKGKILLVND